MNFKIEPKIFEAFPELVLGVIVGSGLDNTGDNTEIPNLLREVEAKVQEEFKQGEVGQDPRIVAWRQAYRKFGCDPHDYRSSVEALTKRVVRGDQLRHINKLVDLYNLISLEYVVPVGGEDISKIKGDVVLDFAKGNEAFITLGENENDSPQPGEIVYKDNEGVLCRRWNWREGDRTKITESTKDVFMVIEGLPPIDRDLAQQATGSLAKLVEKYCGGKAISTVLDKKIQEFALT
ncbi:MAG: B3/4 domain-containing protein [bacterium]|nr:B3/4 domain-containing protein [bacterium]